MSYWFSRVDESGLSADASEAHERCWRCGYKHRLERCHIIPHSLGGRDEPANLVLLCKRCHAEGPNVADPEIMWDWIKASGTQLYDTFWNIEGMREYELIYGKSAESELQDLGIYGDQGLLSREELNILSEKYARPLMEKISTHYGQPYLNRATVAGICRMVIKEIAREHGKSFPDTNRE